MVQNPFCRSSARHHWHNVKLDGQGDVTCEHTLLNQITRVNIAMTRDLKNKGPWNKQPNEWKKGIVLESYFNTYYNLQISII